MRNDELARVEERGRTTSERPHARLRMQLGDGTRELISLAVAVARHLHLESRDHALVRIEISRLHDQGPFRSYRHGAQPTPAAGQRRTTHRALAP
jgi:ribosomal protein S13